MSTTTETVKPESKTVVIVGYEPDTSCEHCGRALIHGIRLDNGCVVGAQCFNNVLTKAKIYQGKKFRIGAENVVKYAKVAERYTEAEGMKRFGIGISQRTFELA